MESLRIKSSIQKSLEKDLIRRVGINNEAHKALKALALEMVICILITI